MTDTDSRRDALKIIGAVGLTCAYPFAADELYAQTEHHSARALVQVSPAAPQYFSAEDRKLVSKLADLIIPETDTPGAAAAGVPAYIEFVVGASERQQVVFREGIQALERLAQEKFAKTFLELSEEQQVKLLTPLSLAADAGQFTSAADRFFGAVKSMTADGYFTSKAGLMEALGYRGNTVTSEFRGACPAV